MMPLRALPSYLQQLLTQRRSDGDGEQGFGVRQGTESVSTSNMVTFGIEIQAVYCDEKSYDVRRIEYCSSLFAHSLRTWKGSSSI